jgi:hypothetical protein
MDRVERYREILRGLIEDYASGKPAHGNIEPEAIIDPVRDRYVVMHVGWQCWRRVHGCMLHVDIINDKFWIQYEGTDRPIAEALVDAGVPREDIVLAFHEPEMRQYTGYAVA